MDAVRRIRGCKWMAAAVFCVGAANADAEVFYAGDTKGMPGETVELSINARAGTVLDSLDIVPDYDAVASVLTLMSFTQTPAFSDGGDVLCNSNVCVVGYITPKSFAADTPLASLKFSIAPNAPVGPVPFDAGVSVGDDLLPIPGPQNFEVLAVPEPEQWALLLAGLGMAALKLKLRRRRSDRT